jgi:hypothetical protein
MKACTTCAAELSARNKSGYCKRHVSAANAADPAWREKQRAGAIRAVRDNPERLAQLRKGIVAAGKLPQAVAARRKRCIEERLWERGHQALQADRSHWARGGRRGSETKLAWCPPELRDEYRKMTISYRYSAAESRKMIEDHHEVAMERWRRSVGIGVVKEPVKVAQIEVPPAIDPALPVVDRAIAAAAWRLGTSPKEVRSRTRAKPAVHARWAAIVRLREDGLSFPKIGAALGMDHTSILYGYQQAGPLAARCMVFADALELARAA